MNAFFIGSPLQLLNAIEARHRVDGLAPPPVLIVSRGGSNLAMMQPLLGLGIWSELVYLQGARGLSIRHDLRRLEQVVRDFGPFQTVCLGDYRFDMMRHFAAVANPERLVLLDDGLGSLFVDERGQNVRTPTGQTSRLKAGVKRVLLGQKDRPSGTVVYFSAYDLTYCSRQNTIKNDYAFLRSHINLTTPLPYVYFVGSPLPEAGIMTNDLYLAYVQAVKRFFSGKTVVYIAHRRETDARLAAIATGSGVTTQRFSTIIEWELVQRGRLPAVLAGFTSAALLNCHYIFGNALRIMSFHLRPEDQAKQHRADSEFVYDHYRKRIEVVDPTPRLSEQVVDFRPLP